jgi:hypothetical protein
MPARCAAWPPALFDALTGVDLILHAGDVGELWVLDQLSQIAPVVAVHGNDDTPDAQAELPYQQVIALGGRRLLLWHSHYPDWQEETASRRGDDLHPKLARQVARARRAGASIVVFGHWHIPLVYEADGVTVINPGALASGSDFTRQLRQTVAVLDIGRSGQVAATHIDLAQPDRVYRPDVDWDAGFAAALAQYSATILAPELSRLVPYLQAHLSPDMLETARNVARPLAHRCWRGELPLLTLEMFLEELHRDATVPANLREIIASII